MHISSEAGEGVTVSVARRVGARISILMASLAIAISSKAVHSDGSATWFMAQPLYTRCAASIDCFAKSQRPQSHLQ